MLIKNPRRISSLILTSVILTADFFTTTIAMSSSPKLERFQNGMIHINPADGAPIKGSMILLHGLGDTSSGWADFAMMLAKEVPGMRFVLPTAPSIPVTLNNGYVMPAWYDIKSLSEDGNRECDNLEESKTYILNLLEKERSKIGDESKLFLGGFSQGGALSLYTGLQLPNDAPSINGVLCMSGYLPESDKFVLSERCKTIPVHMMHGDADEVVKMNWAELSRDSIKQAGVNTVEWSTYPGMPHSACIEELKDVVTWIKKLL